MFEMIDFNKSGMTDVDAYTGRLYAGVAIIFKGTGNLSCYELDCQSDRILPVAISDSLGNITHVFINVYVPFFNSGSTDKYIEILNQTSNIN